MDAAREWLQHKVSRRLLSKGLTAQQLVQAVGGSTSSWQNKLNGNRKIQIEDLLALAIAVDGGLGEVLPQAPQDLRDFVPPSYGDWLSHRSLDSGMPHFREPRVDVDWAALATHVEAWWSTEEERGRAWAITRQVLVHAILVHSQHAGLEPASAAIAADTDTHLDLDWPVRQTRVRVVWQYDGDGRPDSSTVSSLVAHGARCLWEMAEFPELDKMLVLAAPRVVTANLVEAAGLRADGNANWSTLGLTEAERLGCVPSALAMGDVQAQLVQPAVGGRVACFRVK